MKVAVNLAVRRQYFFIFLLFLIPCFPRQAISFDHPLLPGVRSETILQTDWPVTFHDLLLTGFSPLKCNMDSTPRVWSEFQLGGKARWSVYLADDAEKSFLLLCDSRLRRFDLNGNQTWSTAGGELLFYEDLHEGVFDNSYSRSHQKTLGLLSGNTLQLINPNSGEVYWQKNFPGYVGIGKIRIGKTALENPGKQIIVFPQHWDEGFCYGFEKNKLEPVEIWKTEAGVNDWATDADHGVSTIIGPGGSLIWNTRHHTINIHDVKTGQFLNRFEFKINGEFKRNYGPTLFGKSKEGKDLISIIGQRVQDHISTFVRRGTEDPELVYHKYIGEVYRDHGIQLWLPVDGMKDINGDGGMDLVCSRRIIEPGIQTQTVITDLGTGEENVIPDSWIAGIVSFNNSQVYSLLTYADPQSEMTRQGKLHIYEIGQDSRPVLKMTFDDLELIQRVPLGYEQPENAAWTIARMETPVKTLFKMTGGKTGAGVFVRDHRNKSIQLLYRNGQEYLLKEVTKIPFYSEILSATAFPEQEMIRVVVQNPEGFVQVFPLTMQLEQVRGSEDQKIEVSGGGNLHSAASDLDGDGTCELVVTTPNDGLNVYQLDETGKEKLLWSGTFQARENSGKLGPVIFDINGDGNKNILGFGKGVNSKPSVILYSQTGTVLWESTLPMPDTSTIVMWRPGQFLGPKHPGVFVSVEQGQTLEKSFLLDGKDGRILWSGNPIDTDRGTRAMNPLGIPVVYDANHDGAEDLLLDYRDYMSILDGRTGEFIQKPVNLGTTLNEWIAYNSLLPVFQKESRLPSYLIMSGFGGIGFFQDDFITSYWYQDLEYNMPAKVAVVDVDGDGSLEVGYENNKDGLFICRDIWSGKEKWKIKLPGRGFWPVISADFDGDGKGEFLVSGHCLGTDSNGNGEVRWKLKTPNSPFPIIADFNGDGIGEIVTTHSDGTVRILKGK